jgi:FkbM family methyltransferase
MINTFILWNVYNVYNPLQTPLFQCPTHYFSSPLELLLDFETEDHSRKPQNRAQDISSMTSTGQAISIGSSEKIQEKAMIGNRYNAHDELLFMSANFSYPVKKSVKDGFNLVIGIPVLPLNTTSHQIMFPPGVKRVWFDIGAHKEAMYSLPSILEQEDLAVIALEPMFDMWGQLSLQRRHKRLYAIPAAIHVYEGYFPFRRAVTDMCSSLKDVVEAAKYQRWSGGCDGTSYTFNVPTLRLETIIELLPEDLPIEFVKVDAQGSDFEVMQSAGRLLRRIHAFVVEVQLKPLYAGVKNESDYIDFFGRLGFEMVVKKMQNTKEENILFRNIDFPLSPNIPIERFFS